MFGSLCTFVFITEKEPDSRIVPLLVHGAKHGGTTYLLVWPNLENHSLWYWECAMKLFILPDANALGLY